MENPVKETRAAMGLATRGGRVQFARLVGVPYDRLAKAETGYLPKLPARWREGFERAGIPFDPLREAYARWLGTESAPPAAG